MGESGEGRVTCPSCAKQFRWKAELAGKTVRCKCGQTFPIPAEPPGDGALDLADGDGAIGLADEGGSGRCPSCGHEAQPGAVICLNCGFNLKTGEKMHTQTGPAPAPAPPAATGDAIPSTLAAMGRPSATAMALERGDDDIAKQKFTDIYLPAGLIGLGVIVVFLEYFFSGTFGSVTGATGGLLMASMAVTFTLIITVPFLLVGIMLAARIGGISFGPVHTALFKLAAIALGPPAIAHMISVALTATIDETGFASWWIALFAQWGIYWGLVAALFSLDAFETMVTVTVIFIVRLFSRLLLGLLLASMFM